jgi:hypothetical protein
MVIRRTQIILRGGPSNGVKLTADVDVDTDIADSVNQTGYIYRDSGRSFHGLRIFDWLPAVGR